MSDPATRCERMRERAALAPDGELSELERRLLGAHLERCRPCLAFARDVEAVVQGLRDAAPVRLGRPMQLPRPSTVRPRVRAAALVAVAAMAVGIGIRTPVPAADRAPAAAPAADPVVEMQVLRELRREALVASAAAPEERPQRFGSLPA